ncbi:peptidoglycan-associated lipoprotein Pal [Thiohalobacter thiocyanaticus]|uniref:Peptidoglycan-associated lipoprotein n=1 Tax=Thiohalobacter thiocyanaticus TaxID=585455 RepID=A0A426QHD5_9GAMM|nr:peptidoglycan-associated lipoprotein Pal [Thiohalobacter thiocyanaticus]RRQ21167.1 peptidoglycan-associated lipoprotein Pal [Thiohalobacter thiocyanaticus]
MNIRIGLVWTLALAVLSGCGTMDKRDADDVAVEDRGAATGAEGAQSRGLGADGDMRGMALDDPDSPLSVRTIYFEFDSSEVAAEDREVVAAHARYLSANPQQQVVLEGHADERGSREYNIGLGDRRAQSVRRMLEFQGVTPDQVRTVSYGEEKPAVEGHDEQAWRQNRRVEIVYMDQ